MGPYLSAQTLYEYGMLKWKNESSWYIASIGHLFGVVLDFSWLEESTFP